MDAVSFVVSAVTLLLIRTRDSSSIFGFRASEIKREISEGIAIVFGSRDLRLLLAATTTTNFGAGLIAAVSLIYKYRTLHLQPGLLGSFPASGAGICRRHVVRRPCGEPSGSDSRL